MPARHSGTRDAETVEREQALKQAIMSMTPEEGAQWVEVNVTNLATAKAHLKRLTKVVIALAHKID